MDGRVIVDLFDALVPSGFVWDALIPDSTIEMRSIIEMAGLAGVPAGEFLTGHEKEALYIITANDAPVKHAFEMIDCVGILDTAKAIEEAVKVAQDKLRDYDAGLRALRKSGITKDAVEALERAINACA